MLADIQNAHSSIRIETYTFNGDLLGERIAQALIAAKKRGVDVKVLVDGAGTPVWGGNMTKRLERAGIATRIFHPFPWRLWQWSRSWVRLPKLLKAIYLMLKINSRNHRKVIIIDEHIVYVGSFNISKCHLSHIDGGDSWRDTGLRIITQDTKDLIKALDAAWNHVPIKERIKEFFQHINTNPQFRLNNTRHRRRILYKRLLRRIDNAKQRIWITNAYFVPDSYLLNKLRDAAQRGIDVRILLPHKSDVFVMPWASSAFYYNLLKAGVRIFEYLPNILHAKTLIIDEWPIVGSSNLNHRSLRHDLEVDINLRSEHNKTLLAQTFIRDLEQANEISLNNWWHRPWYQRFIGRLALYMKYWI